MSIIYTVWRVSQYLDLTPLHLPIPHDHSCDLPIPPTPMDDLYPKTELCVWYIYMNICEVSKLTF